MARNRSRFRALTPNAREGKRQRPALLIAASARPPSTDLSRCRHCRALSGDGSLIDRPSALETLIRGDGATFTKTRGRAPRSCLSEARLRIEWGNGATTYRYPIDCPPMVVTSYLLVEIPIANRNQKTAPSRWSFGWTEIPEREFTQPRQRPATASCLGNPINRFGLLLTVRMWILLTCLLTWNPRNSFMNYALV